MTHPASVEWEAAKGGEEGGAQLFRDAGRMYWGDVYTAQEQDGEWNGEIQGSV